MSTRGSGMAAEFTRDDELEMSQKKKVEEAVRLLRSVTGGNGSSPTSSSSLADPSGLNTVQSSKPGLNAEGI